MREIKQKMIDFIDSKLKENGAAQDAITRKDPRSVFIYAAEACVGIREVKDNSGPLVELIQRTLGNAEKEAWCMSFVQTCLAYAEVKTGVKSQIAASEHCLTVWNETPKNMRVRVFPKSGAIVIWKHGDTTNGHTGVVTEWHVTHFETVEGNTFASHDIQREGGGVFINDRKVSSVSKMKILGFLKPF